MAAASRGRPELLVQPMFSVGALVSEASATLAADLAFPDEDRVRFEREQLLPLTGLLSGGHGPAAKEIRDIARHVRLSRSLGTLQIAQSAIAARYLDGELEFARAAERLEHDLLVPDAGPLLKYFNEYRSYVTTYTAGRAAAAAFMDRCAGNAPSDRTRWRCFEQLIRTTSGL